MLFLYFVIISFFVIILSVGVSYYAEKIEASLITSYAIVGMILLALATSLPELTTAVVTASDNQPELLLSNILGSNFFNLLILSTLQIIFWKDNIFSKIPRSYLLSFSCLIIMHIIVLFSLSVVHSTNIFTFIPSVIIIALYFFTIRLSPGSDSAKTPASKSKKPFALFLLFALLLITTAFLLIKTVKEISITYHFSSLFAGSILIGIVTSLPELVASITLVKRKQYTLLIEAIIGSNILNLLILIIGDFIMFNQSIFSITPATPYIQYLILLIISALFFWFLLFMNKRKSIFHTFLPYILSVLTFLLYGITFFI